MRVKEEAQRNGHLLARGYVKPLFSYLHQPTLFICVKKFHFKKFFFSTYINLLNYFKYLHYNLIEIIIFIKKIIIIFLSKLGQKKRKD